MQVAQLYKQINAPVGQFGLASLSVSTRALASNSAGDSTYADLESQLSALGAQRDSTAAQMLAMLENAEFNGQQIDKNQAHQLINQANNLLDQINSLAGTP
jgi:hypothetical protein